jgi:hypothetical protein
MCGYALKLAGIRKVYFILANSKFGGLKSLMEIKGVDFQQVDYRTSEVIDFLKNFYNIGNDKLDPSKRHRKPKKTPNNDDKANNQTEVKNTNKELATKNNTNIFNLLGKRQDHLDGA